MLPVARDLRSTLPREVAKYGLRYGGKDTASVSGKTFVSIDPTTGAPWAEFADAEQEDVNRAVSAAASAFEQWSATSATQRGRALMRFADLVAAHADDLALLEVRQNGKLLREMTAQLRMVPEWFYYFGGLADKIEGTVVPLDKPTILNYTLREPIGVVGVILPWNSPALVAAMGSAPALAAGCTVVVKPSEFAPAAVIELSRLADLAGMPPGTFNVLSGGQQSGQALVAHPGVAKVTFTGSPRAGRSIATSVAARLASYLLELGGKSANIVFRDADLDAAEAGVLAGIFAAGGQTCLAGSRLLIDRSIYDEFLARIVSRSRAIRLGDPLAATTQMGPIATAPQLAVVESMVDRARESGADVLSGGCRAEVDNFPCGYFYEPTILTANTAGDAICQEEVFGPVLAAMPFSTDDEAISLANDTRFGLAAGVWTRDIKRAHRAARLLKAGTVWINLYRAIAYNSPFGGYKDSGVGRENGVGAVNEYLQTKSVWCELGDEIQDPFVLKV